MPQLEFSNWISQIFWLVITFTSMYFLMLHLVLPRIKSITERRDQKISGDLNRAKELQVEAEQILKTYTEKLKSTHEETANKLLRIRKEAEGKHNEVISKLQKENAKIINSAVTEIEKAKIASLASMDSSVEVVASEIIAKIQGESPEAKNVKSAMDSMNN